MLYRHTKCGSAGQPQHRRIDRVHADAANRSHRRRGAIYKRSAHLSSDRRYTAEMLDELLAQAREQSEYSELSIRARLATYPACGTVFRCRRGASGVPARP